ncbi:MAG: autoinducer binding domain-containing protein [Alphaproteobacteria bacterium]
MEIIDYIEASNKAESKEELLQLFKRAIGDFGFDLVMYNSTRAFEAEEADNSSLILTNYPTDWLTMYGTKEFETIDPVLRYGTVASRPFSWDGLSERLPLSKRQMDFMGAGKEAGLYDGVGIPLHGPRGEVSGIGLASSSGGAELSQSLSVLNALAHQFHLNYWAFSEQPEIVEVSLTEREREVLHWCAQGKSNWAIGEILGISEHGVEFHVRNILKKLEVDSRVTAVVKALHLGLITP